MPGFSIEIGKTYKVISESEMMFTVLSNELNFLKRRFIEVTEKQANSKFIKFLERIN